MVRLRTPDHVKASTLEQIKEQLADGAWHNLAVSRNYGWAGRLVAAEAVQAGIIEQSRGRYRLRTPTANASTSLRQAILDELAANAPVGSMELTVLLRKQGVNVAAHEVQHVVQSLQRQGLVTFVENKNGSVKTLGNIRLIVGKAEPPAAYPETEAWSPDDLSEIVNVAPNPRSAITPISIPLLFPLLDRLRNRKRLVNMAAEALEEAGLDDEALRLLNLPIENTPLEEEYLKFAARYELG
jgi:hypothetical protein